MVFVYVAINELLWMLFLYRNNNNNDDDDDDISTDVNESWKML